MWTVLGLFSLQRNISLVFTWKLQSHVLWNLRKSRPFNYKNHMKTSSCCNFIHNHSGNSIITTWKKNDFKYRYLDESTIPQNYEIMIINCHTPSDYKKKVNRRLQSLSFYSDFLLVQHFMFFLINFFLI